MGPKRIKALLSSFEGIENIANADTSIIATRANIPLKIAEDIILVERRFQMEQKSK